MILLNECLDVLEGAKVFSKEDSDLLHKQFQSKFSFTLWGKIEEKKLVDFLKVKSIEDIYKVLENKKPLGRVALPIYCFL